MLFSPAKDLHESGHLGDEVASNLLFPSNPSFGAVVLVRGLTRNLLVEQVPLGKLVASQHADGLRLEQLVDIPFARCGRWTRSHEGSALRCPITLRSSSRPRSGVFQNGNAPVQCLDVHAVALVVSSISSLDVRRSFAGRLICVGTHGTTYSNTERVGNSRRIGQRSVAAEGAAEARHTVASGHRGLEVVDLRLVLVDVHAMALAVPCLVRGHQHVDVTHHVRGGHGDIVQTSRLLRVEAGRAYGPHGRGLDRHSNVVETTLGLGDMLSEMDLGLLEIVVDRLEALHDRLAFDRSIRIELLEIADHLGVASLVLDDVILHLDDLGLDRVDADRHGPHMADVALQLVEDAIDLRRELDRLQRAAKVLGIDLLGDLKHVCGVLEPRRVEVLDRVLKHGNLGAVDFQLTNDRGDRPFVASRACSLVNSRGAVWPNRLAGCSRAVLGARTF